MASLVHNTLLPADSIEWCPHENGTTYLGEQSRNVFSCGTYKLDDDTNTRQGSATLFEV